MASTQDQVQSGRGSGAQDSSDGRLARSARTRRAIVDALRSLHQDGDLRPTAPRVAERAGVSLRTVWQHFEDLETLFAAAGERDAEIAAGFVAPIDPAAALQERIEALVEQRSAMFEAMAPPWRAARLQEPFSPQIRRNRDRLIELGREQLEELFAAELRRLPASRRRAATAALQAVTNWAMWESLRAELRLSPEQARQALLLLVSKVVSNV